MLLIFQQRFSFNIFYVFYFFHKNVFYFWGQRFLRQINAWTTNEHRRQSWGCWGSRTPRFWVGRSWGSQADRKGVVDGYRNIIIAYFAQKVFILESGLFQETEKMYP